MVGPIVNGITIIICGIIGTYLVKGVPKRFQEIIMKAVGISLIYIGISGALQNQRVMILILSMVIGAFMGEIINIDKWMKRLGAWAELKMGFGEGDFSKGFVAATLLFCTGSMAIVGSMESGLMGNYDMLFAKSILDGILSIIFAAQMGIGVSFSAVPVFIYEGIISLGATLLKDVLTTEIITEMSAVGSLLIALLGFNMMEVKEVKVANMIPAIFLPWVFIAIEHILPI